MNKTAFLLAAAFAGGAALPAFAADGKTLFQQNCSACHQVSGLGIPGAFPALKGNVLVQGDPVVLATTVLKGRAGMPAFADQLDDDALGLIFTYIRSGWGNKADAMSSAQVKTVREAIDAQAAKASGAGIMNAH